jgi:murein hydrolase activator
VRMPRCLIRLILLAAMASNTAWILGFGAPVRAQTVAQKAAAEQEKQRLNELRDRINQLQRDLSKSEETRTEAADALKQSEKAISEVNRGLVTLTQEQNKITQALGETQQSIEAKRTDAGKQQDLLNRTIRHQYIHGNTDALRLVLDGQDVSAAERQLQYFGYVSKARAAAIGQLKQSLTNLSQLEAAARVKKDELAANALEQQKARATLEGERQSRQKVLLQVAGDISKSRKEIGRLKRDEDRLTKLVDRLAKELARQLAAQQAAQQAKRREERIATPNVPSRIRKPGESVDSVADGGFAGQAFETLRGKLKLPARGELAGRFGAPREEGGVTWKGLFIKADTGQQVKAVADGRVVFADWLRGFGNLLIVDHGNGYMSLYGNNESLLKQVGENTQSGENIALVGATGGALESGVYFELRHEGKPFDPMKWVSR